MDKIENSLNLLHADVMKLLDMQKSVATRAHLRVATFCVVMGLTILLGLVT